MAVAERPGPDPGAGGVDSPEVGPSPGSSGGGGKHRRARRLAAYSVVGAQEGGWSLTPMENLLRGVRNESEFLALELYSMDGVVGYLLRTDHGVGMTGMLSSYFPQAKVASLPFEHGAPSDRLDWMYLGEGEQALVQTLYLEDQPFLPLRIFEDHTLRESEMDPLAGLIGVLGNATHGDDESRGRRLGVRLLMRPARESWNAQWRDRMQQRRDGDDRSKPEPQGSTSSLAVGLVMGAGLLAGVNFMLWANDHMMWLVPANAGMLAAGIGGAALWGKLGSGKKRAFIDEQLVEAKLKSLAFNTEVQLVRVFPDAMADYEEDQAYEDLASLVDCLRSYDDPVGNSWRLGKMTRFRGVDIFNEAPFQDDGDKRKQILKHPFRYGSQHMDWLSKADAMRTVLSAREVASLWHPPLGSEEMASMERSASVHLVPFLGDLTGPDADSGPRVGMVGARYDSVLRLPDSALAKHTLLLGKSGGGKSTLLKHVVHHKLLRKAEGLDDSAIVVVDPHADLVRDILTFVPPQIADRVRLLDFGRLDRVPGINVLDPLLFPDRDRCVDTIVTTLRYLWDAWGNRLEDILKRNFLIMYEFNDHPRTKRQDMLTFLDILKLIDDGVTAQSSRGGGTQRSSFQQYVLERVSDPSLTAWFDQFLNWGRETKGDAVGPVHSRVGAYASSQRASVVMGQRESTIILSDILKEGLVLLVSTASGSIGQEPAALMGGTMISLVESALRAQEDVPADERKKCLLCCDEFQTVTGANWEGMFAEIRKYGGCLCLATQSLARLDTGDRKLKSALLANAGCLVGYQLSAEDAHIVSEEMDPTRVAPHHLTNLDAHHCIVRINSSRKCYPAFTMKTLAPPDSVSGSADNVAAVVRASEKYTLDWETAHSRLREDIQRKASGQFYTMLSDLAEDEGEEGDGPSGNGPDDGGKPDGGPVTGGPSVVKEQPKPATGGPELFGSASALDKTRQALRSGQQPARSAESPSSSPVADSDQPCVKGREAPAEATAEAAAEALGEAPVSSSAAGEAAAPGPVSAAEAVPDSLGSDRAVAAASSSVGEEAKPLVPLPAQPSPGGTPQPLRQAAGARDGSGAASSGQAEPGAAVPADVVQSTAGDGDFRRQAGPDVPAGDGLGTSASSHAFRRRARNALERDAEGTIVRIRYWDREFPVGADGRIEGGVFSGCFAEQVASSHTSLEILADVFSLAPWDGGFTSLLWQKGDAVRSKWWDQAYEPARRAIRRELEADLKLDMSALEDAVAAARQEHGDLQSQLASVLERCGVSSLEELEKTLNRNDMERHLEGVVQESFEPRPRSLDQVGGGLQRRLS